MTYDHQIIYCDSLMARFPCKRFNVYGSSLTPHSHTVHKTSFNKTPLTTIIKHSKGTIGNIWISIFYLYWYHAHTDYILMDCRWCTCNLFSSFSWFLIVICYCSVDNVFPHHLYKCYSFFSWCSFFHRNSSKLDLSNQIRVCSSAGICCVNYCYYWLHGSRSWFLLHIRHLDRTSSWLFCSSVLVVKYFILFCADSFVLSRYISTALLENKGSLTSIVSFSTKAMMSDKLSPLRWCILMVNACLFLLPLMCLGNFEIIKDNVFSKSRTFQLCFDFVLWNFRRKL